LHRHRFGLIKCNVFIAPGYASASQWYFIGACLFSLLDGLCLTHAVIIALFPLAVPLASCCVRWVRPCFVLCKVGSIIMTVAMSALYLILVHFYALAFLASCSARWVRLRFVLCKAGSIIMTVAINALYLPLVDF
jgi:hypothetical protein